MDKEKGASSETPVDGNIFCLSDPSMPGLIYIGATLRPVSVTLKEINSFAQTEEERLGYFKLEWSEQVEDVWTIETKIKNKLDSFQDPEQEHYFRCSPEEAHDTLRTLL